MSVSCVRCELSGRGLSVGLITRQGVTQSGVSECDREASIMRRPWPTRGCCTMKKKIGGCGVIRFIIACSVCVLEVVYSVVSFSFIVI
jgi:hypothetical protein